MSHKKPTVIPVVKTTNLGQRRNHRKHCDSDSESKSEGTSECSTERKHSPRKEKRCFGNCCSQAAKAYGKFYLALGQRSLDAIDPVAIAHPTYKTYVFTALQATIFGAIPGFPSIQPAVRAALAAVAQSCSKKCCCEITDTIIDTALGYVDLALTTVLTTPDTYASLLPLGLAHIVNSDVLFGIVPPVLLVAPPGVVLLLPDFSDTAINPGLQNSALGLLILSFSNTLRTALDSFCPKALKLYDSWNVFSGTGELPVPPLPAIKQQKDKSKDEPKKDEPKKDEPKKDEPKKDEPQLVAKHSTYRREIKKRH